MIKEKQYLIRRTEEGWVVQERLCPFIYLGIPTACYWKAYCQEHPYGTQAKAEDALQRTIIMRAYAIRRKTRARQAYLLEKGTVSYVR